MTRDRAVWAIQDAHDVAAALRQEIYALTFVLIACNERRRIGDGLLFGLAYQRRQPRRHRVGGVGCDGITGARQAHQKREEDERSSQGGHAFTGEGAGSPRIDRSFFHVDKRPVISADQILSLFDRESLNGVRAPQSHMTEPDGG